MKVEVSIAINNTSDTPDGPFASTSTTMILDVQSTNPVQTVADLTIAAEKAVREMKV